MGAVMKLAALVLLSGFLSAFGAVTGPVRLGNSQYADTEVSTNVAFAAWTERMFAFEYELDFDGTPSNNVQVAFGIDADGDRILSPEEERLVVGWDCGEWFMRNVAEETTLAQTPIVDDGSQLFRFSLRFGSDGSFGHLDIRDGGTPTFYALAAEPPSWLHDRRWNLCRVTARGVGVHASSFVVKATQNGTRFIFR